MLTEHTLLLAELGGETRAAQITPVACGLQRAVAAAAGAETASLQMLSSPALDRAYVEWEVLTHLHSLALIDGVFATGARSERLLFTIRSMRDLETQHEAFALAEQRALDGECAPDGGD
jgi:hypothetical protein